jgi:hypothetical protein
MTRSRHNLYNRANGGILRAALRTTGPTLGPWPTSDSPVEVWCTWLRDAWVDEDFARAVAVASPDLARQVNLLLSGQISDARRARRAALAVGRYAIRLTCRSTPFGLFAGVAPIEFGSTSRVRFGERHQQFVRPEPVALAGAIAELEADAQLMAGIDVCVNNLATVRGDRVFVPAEGADENSMALTPVIAKILEAAKTPIAHGELLGKLLAEFPGASQARCAAALAKLLQVGLLRSALRAPATVVDPSDALPRTWPCELRELGEKVAVDVLLDADVRLPEAVGVEMETAATLLARLAMYPSGIPAWSQYVERFAERYGEGVLVSVPLLTDTDQALGFPDGFGKLSMPPRAMSRRDRVLLELAQTAALDGAQAVTLTGAMIEEIQAAAGPPPTFPAPHLELCAQVCSPSLTALDRGDFRILVSTASRDGGSMAGRFWHLLPEAVGGSYADLPTVVRGAATAQLSFHPSRLHADLLTRAPKVLSTVVSVGEHRSPGEGVLMPEDLAVGLADGRLFLAVADTGQPIELLTPNAVNFIWNNYTPPMARFLAEIARAACPQVTGFAWAAALVLPFTPALHYRRTILMPARWRLRARDLPGRSATLAAWADALFRWRERHRMPARVLLTVDDQRLPLDLDNDMHLDVLRASLAATDTALLQEAPPPEADGWIGGRSHSVVVTMGARS